MANTSNGPTLEQIKAAVAETFIRDDKEAQILRAINDTYKEMVACVDPRKMQDQIYKPVVINREEYPIPDTVLRINHPIRLLEPGSSNNSSESYPLDFVTKDKYDELEPNPNASTIVPGRPHSYAFFKNSILLTSIPDKAYILEVNIGGEASELSENSDQVIFSPTWLECLKAGTLARLYAGLEMWDTADKWSTIYQYGFLGDDKNITGGIRLLRKLNEDLTKAHHIVEPRDF